MLLVICHLSCDVIGYEGSKCDWCFLIHLLSQLDSHWLLVKLSLVQSFYCCQLSTTVLFRTKLTQTIIFHLLMKWLLGSNLSQLYILLLFSQSKPRSKPRFEPVQGNYFDIFSSSKDKWWYGVIFRQEQGTLQGTLQVWYGNNYSVRPAKTPL